MRRPARRRYRSALPRRSPATWHCSAPGPATAPNCDPIAAGFQRDPLGLTANAGNLRFFWASSKVTPMRPGAGRRAMSKSRIGIAVVVLATVMSSAALARVHLGIGPLGGARFALTRLFSLGGLPHARSLARHGHIRKAALRSQDIPNAMDSGGLVSKPVPRGQIAAAAALAGWHGGHVASGWWRHGDGGYGWVGPLFWPFAYSDIYDYTVWGDGIGFWDYGYAD